MQFGVRASFHLTGFSSANPLHETTEDVKRREFATGVDDSGGARERQASTRVDIAVLENGQLAHLRPPLVIANPSHQSARAKRALSIAIASNDRTLPLVGVLSEKKSKKRSKRRRSFERDGCKGGEEGKNQISGKTPSLATEPKEKSKRPPRPQNTAARAHLGALWRLPFEAVRLLF